MQVAATMGMTAEEINNGSESFEKLEKAAKEMGATTQFSASESAEALNYLALAGYDVDTAISTLPKVLNLAAAGGMDLASASDMVTDALSALGMGAEEADRFVDVLAKTSQKSNTSVQQLGEGLLTVGGTAKSLSGGLEEASTVLGIFADNGIKGSEGGTALRNVILSLSAPTDKAAQALKDLGVEAFDSNGNMRPLNETFSELDGELSKLTDQEKTQVLSEIFNKVDLKSVNALLANSGDRFSELSGYINDADGAASDMADTMNNNLSGQLTLLKSGMEGAGIAIGEALLPYIKILVGFINDLVTWFNNLYPSIQTAIVTVGLLVAGIGPLLMVVGTLITALPVLGAGFAFITGPIGLVIMAITALIAIGVALWQNWDEVKAKAKEIWDSIVNSFNEWMNNIKTDITNTWNNIKKFCTDTWNNIKNKASEIWSGIVNSIKQWVNNMKTDIENKFNNVKTFISNIWDNIKNKISEAWDNIKKNVSDAVDNVKLTISNVWNTLYDILTSPFRRAKEFIDDIFSGISNAVSNVIDSVSGIFGRSVDVNVNNATEMANNPRAINEEGILLARNMVNSDNLAKMSIAETVQGFGKSIKSSTGNNASQKDVKVGSNVVINNTYNSPKPSSIRDLKKQDEIQMRRLSMQLGF